MKRTKAVLKSKLNEGNMVRAGNNYAISVIRHSRDVVDYKKSKLQNMDCKTRNIMATYQALPQEQM